MPQRQAVARAKSRLAASDPADQSIRATNSRRGLKGALTKANKVLAAAKASGRHRATLTSRNRVLRRGGPRAQPGALTTTRQVVTPEVITPTSRPRAADRPGSMTHTLRATLRELAQADARRIRELEAITGEPIRVPRSKPQVAVDTGNRVRDTAKGGKVAATLRASLRELAQSDARTAREMAQIIDMGTPKLPGSAGSGKPKRVRRSGGRRRLPGG